METGSTCSTNRPTEDHAALRTIDLNAARGPTRVTGGGELNLLPTEAHMLRACDFVTCGWMISAVGRQELSEGFQVDGMPDSQTRPSWHSARQAARDNSVALTRNIGGGAINIFQDLIVKDSARDNATTRVASSAMASVTDNANDSGTGSATPRAMLKSSA